MRKFVIIITLILLLFNSAGALFGGFKLFTDPTGNSLQMPLSFLEHSPFSSYLLPGIILFIVNGLFGLVCTIFILFRLKTAPLLVMLQGIILTGWITIQMILLQIFYPPLHLPFLIIGIILFVSGFYLRRRK